MFTVTQILGVLLIWTVYLILSNMMLLLPYGTAVLIGLLVGAFLGDAQTGLLIGGTMELMSIGMNPLGGSSVPDYYTGAVVGVAFAVATGQGMDVGIAVGMTVGTLGVQLDVFNKMIGTWFAHKVAACNEKMDFKGMERWVVLRFVACITLGVLPVLIVLVLGEPVVELIVNSLPQWFMNGLSVAGGCLPGVGFAILLHSLPIKRNFMYVILGYALAAFFGANALAVSILAFVIAWVYYQNAEKEKPVVAATSADGGIEDDE